MKWSESSGGSLPWGWSERVAMNGEEEQSAECVTNCDPQVPTSGTPADRLRRAGTLNAVYSVGEAT
jgi:hypothetical protein